MPTTGSTLFAPCLFQSLVLLPLPLYTYGMMSLFQRLYEVPGRHLSLERAIDLDKQSNSAAEFEESGEDIYRQPVLAETDAIPQPYRRVRTSDDVLDELSLAFSSAMSGRDDKIV